MALCKSAHIHVLLSLSLYLMFATPVSAQYNVESISAVVGAAVGSCIGVFLLLLIWDLAFWERCCRHERKSTDVELSGAGDGEPQTQYSNNEDNMVTINEKEPE